MFPFCIIYMGPSHFLGDEYVRVKETLSVTAIIHPFLTVIKT
jgi:hypothetical protein